jgi:hypothetical protein
MIRMRVFRAFALLAAVPTFALISSAAPAEAADAATITGTGTITPGVPCFGCRIDFSFSAVDLGANAGVYTGCTFTGTSSGFENEIGGDGSGVLGGCGISGNVSYSRVGTAVTVTGSVCYGSVCCAISASALQFTPMTVQPPRSFALHGSVHCG